MTRSFFSHAVIAAAIFMLPACQGGETIGVKRYGLMSGSKAVDLAVDGLSNCALADSGQAYCWGENQYGGLGDGTNEDSGIPVLNIAANDFVSIDQSCGVRAGGQLACWGDTLDGRPAMTEEPTLSDVVFASGSRIGGCAIRRGGEVVCWSSIPHDLLSEEQLWEAYENGELEPPRRPILEKQTELSGKRAVDLVGNPMFHEICALVESGDVYCWRSGYWGQKELYRVEGIRNAVAVDGFCALIEGGRIKCWGTNVHGSLGNGHGWVSPYLRESFYDEDQDVILNMSEPEWNTVYPPGFVTGIDDAVEVTSGQGFACALREGGRVSCWGNNERGQLGDGTFVDRWTPVDVAVLDAPAVAVDAGDEQVCAITVGGEVTCWGSRRLLTDDRLPDGSY